MENQQEFKRLISMRFESYLERCPMCKSRSVGKIGRSRYVCRNCCATMKIEKGKKIVSFPTENGWDNKKNQMVDTRTWKFYFVRDYYNEREFRELEV